MRIGLSLPTMLPGNDGDSLRRWCQRAEADRYATLGFGERVAYRNLHLQTTLSFAAAVTTDVRIAATVVVAPMHPAAEIAKAMATLDVLSGGRVTVGLGVGGRSEDYQALGARFDHRFQRLDDQVAEMRRLWAGEPAGAGLDPVGPAPVQDHIPLMSGSMGPRSTQRAARWADGVAGFAMAPDAPTLGAAHRLATDAWAEADREKPPEMWTSFWFALGDDASERLRGYAFNYLSVFGHELADALAASCTAAGDDAVLRGLDAAAAAGYDEVQLVPTTTDMAELDRLGDVLARWGG